MLETLTAMRDQHLAGRKTTSLRLANEAATLARSCFGSEDPRTFEARHAVILAGRLFRSEASADKMRDLLTEARRVLPSGSPLIAVLERDWMAFRAEDDRWRAEGPAVKATFEAALRDHGAASRQTFRARERLLGHLLLRGDPNEIRREARALRADAGEAFGPSDPQALWLSSVVAWCELRLGDVAAAEREYHPVFDRWLGVADFAESGLRDTVRNYAMARRFNDDLIGFWRIHDDRADRLARTNWPRERIGILLSRGSWWRYIIASEAVPEAWHDRAFDDRAWAAGEAWFSIGRGQSGGRVATWPPAHSGPMNVVLFRTTFDVADPGGWSALRLRLSCDNAGVAWLNGKEVARLRLPAGSALSAPAPAPSLADPITYHPEVFTIESSSLVSGKNVLAVEVHRTARPDAGLFFEAQLEGLTP